MSFSKIRDIARRDRLLLRDKLARGVVFENYFIIRFKQRPRFLPEKLWRFLIFLLIDVDSSAK
jgi:hypothetical protein